jgi:pSer/pThr/pTyr-binding forkhead associated (FHA) protein
MSELLLLVFRIAFLAALWVFVFFVVFAVRSDLFGQKVKRMAAPKSSRPSGADQKNVFLPSTRAAGDSAAATSQVTLSDSNAALKLVITAGPKQGEAISLTTKPLSIGRSSDSSIVIRDDYTSTHHARLEFRAGSWVLNDLGSTNGTFLAGKRISEPVTVPLNTAFTIGSTTFEIRA